MDGWIRGNAASRRWASMGAPVARFSCRNATNQVISCIGNVDFRTANGDGGRFLSLQERFSRIDADCVDRSGIYRCFRDNRPV
ncbi:hypothetical protein TcasGA2_TC013533 [Tribolium castaneum]|uniref:Uncharacterized protein n=1 Tax=Tribolium castaneum TaxID=7070 RepID=D6WL04_TRICA|nr:hypothetical protein TcasGA2_TC013533 [Tribolium castaneum]